MTDRQMNTLQSICLIVFLLAAMTLKAVSMEANATTGTVLFRNGQRLNVAAIWGTGLRAENNFKSKVIRRIDYGETLEVVGGPVGSETGTGWIRGHWICAHYKGYEGYVFDGHLSALPIPARKHRKECLKGRTGDIFPGLLKDYVRRHFETVGKSGDDTPPPDNCESSDYESVLQVHPFDKPAGRDSTDFHGTNTETSSEPDAEHMTPHLKTGEEFKFVTRCSNREHFTQLTMKGVRIMDAYHLAAALFYSNRLNKRIIKDLAFIKDKHGSIYKINGRKWSHVYIKRKKNGEVMLKFMSRKH
ncbi:MAG: SH3 domain-containing protein [bacterium]|nr:SH3 domain-containing protein [bacterium]